MIVISDFLTDRGFKEGLGGTYINGNTKKWVISFI